MNREPISAIGQIVGALAVVVSLIYLAREMVEHPYLAELYYRSIQDFQSLKGGDLVRFSALMYQLFCIFRELYFQQLDGHLEPRLWGPKETVMRDINAYPGIQAWWRFHSHSFNKEFANYINQLQQTATRPRYIGKPVQDQ